MATDGTVVGRVGHLDVTAIKGFAVVACERITVTATGVTGNREFFFAEPVGRLYSVDVGSLLMPYWSHYDPSSNVLTIGEEQTTMFEEMVPTQGDIAEFDIEGSLRAGRFVAGPWDEWASCVAHRPLSLVQSLAPGGAYDAYPLTIQSEASLATLGRESDGAPLDGRRFRMQVTLTGVDGAFAEDEWEGRTATLGSCGVRIGGPVPRCLGVEHHPRDQSRSVKVLQTIKRVRGVGHGEFGRGLMFGVYASVVEPGEVAVGDALVVDGNAF